MNICNSVILVIISLSAISCAHAQGGCMKDSIGRVVCAPPCGGIQKDSIGRIVCGPGQCVVNYIDQVICSSRSGGGAMINNIGRVVCVGGCVQADTFYCEIPR